MLESPLQKDLRLQNSMQLMEKIQEARIIAPDLIEYVEGLEYRITILEGAVAAVINQNMRRELKRKAKSVTKGNDS